MSKAKTDKGRRKVLKLALSGVAAVPLSSLMLHRQAWAGDLPHVSEDDATAKALNYVHDAASSTNPKRTENQFCKNCNLVQSTEGAWRPCSIFPGKAVNENGWCSAWVGRG
jgi:hypothetical protein